MTLEMLTLILAGAAAALALAGLAAVRGNRAGFASLQAENSQLREELRALRGELTGQLHTVGGEVGDSVHRSLQAAAAAQRQAAAAQSEYLQALSDQLGQRQAMLQRAVRDQLRQVEEQLKNDALQSEQKLENIRNTMETRIAAMQADNGRRLEEMRATVDEKLQKTLDETLQQSFSRVSQQLESVYKGLGEMQNLAAGVGDLKKVLSNVKTRGILGEIQLGAILEQVLAPEQYARNVATVAGSSERVEYAVRLPGAGAGDTVWLPIDAKFPADAYGALLDAYDAGDAGAVDAAARALDGRLKGFARDIRDKYLHVPETTEFGIMFLPVEGLYAEAVRRGLVESLQSEYKAVIAGPTTMAALLNSLQMGFRTLAIQKRSGEVWQVLSNVKAEFDTFGKALAQAQTRIEQAGSELEKLVGVRTRQIQRKLKSVTLLPQAAGADDGDGEEDE